MKTTAPPTTLMAEEIRQQPEILRRLLARRGEVHAALRGMPGRPFAGIAIVGRGSSGNAALYGRVLLEIATGRPVTVVPPSMTGLYGTSADVHGWLAIGLSQSGRTIEVNETLASMRRCGATTVGVTAHPDSPLAAVSDLVLDLETGRERAVPATKTFTAELAIVAMIAEAVGVFRPSASAWGEAVDAVASALDDERPVLDAAARLSGATHISTIGSGLFFSVALEAALKIQEAARIPATGWSGAGFRHGPITIAGPGHPIVAFAAGPHSADVVRTTKSLGGVPTVLVADGPGADIALPADLPEALTVFPAAVRAQQLALALAIARAVDPDNPPRLRKVTPS